jgi:hypothetical protein
MQGHKKDECVLMQGHKKDECVLIQFALLSTL